MALTENLAGYWKVDELSGDLVDSSGNSRTLTNNAATSLGAASIIGTAADFPAGNATRYFSRNDNCGITGGAISMQMWVKMKAEITSGTRDPSFATCGSATNNINYGVGYDYNAGTRRVYVNRQKQNVSNNPEYFNVSLGTTWHHLVLTYDGTTLYAYVDGVRSTGLATSGNGASAGADLVAFGVENDGFAGGLASNCYMDEFAVWSRALTQVEVKQLYNNGAGLPFPFTIDGSRISNESGNTHMKIKSPRIWS